MKIETLKVTWKLIWKGKYDKRKKVSKMNTIINSSENNETKKSYCRYIAENDKHKHELKTIEGTKLFELLQETVIQHNKSNAERFEKCVYVDGVYFADKLLFIKNPRVV
jgi:hypothetical protein